MAKETYINGLMTPPFRLSYPRLVEPREGMNGGKAKYSLMAMFPKEGMSAEDAAALKAIKEACAKAASTHWKTYADEHQGALPPGIKKPFRDGDNPEHSTSPETKGYSFANLRSTKKPHVFNGKNVEITLADEIKEKLYPGCWARCTLDVAAGENSGSRYVRLQLRNLQKIKDDARLGNAQPEGPAFAEVEGYVDDGAEGMTPNFDAADF